MTVIRVDAVNGSNANDGITSPVATLPNAFVKAAALFPSATSDIAIELRGNWPHNATGTTAISATHNRPNKHRLKIRSYDGEATITARTAVTGWFAAPAFHPRCVSALHAGSARDLYTDAGFEPRRAKLGRFNNAYRVHQWEPSTKTLLIHQDLVPATSGIGGLVMAIPQGWNTSYLPVASITDATAPYKRVAFAEPAATVEFEKGTIPTNPLDFAWGPYHQANQRFWWENRVEFLTSTGDFVKWGDYFYVVLPAGMSAATFNAMGAYVPNGVQSVFSVNGTTTDDWTNKAENIDFEDFRVKHMGYVQANFATHGWIGYDSNIALLPDNGTIQLLGVITIQKARSVNVKHLRMTQTSVPLLRIWSGMHQLNVEGIACHDTDACPVVMVGIMGAGTLNGVPWTSLDTQPVEAQNVGLRMVDNVFLRTARVYMGFNASLGCWHFARVRRNMVKDCTGGAFQVGRGARWYETMWDTDWQIDHNDVDNVLNVLTDASAIYSNGNQSGRMSTRPVLPWSLVHGPALQAFCNRLRNIYKSGYDPSGGASTMFYADLGARSNAYFGNLLENGEVALNHNGAQQCTFETNRVVNVSPMPGIRARYSANQIFPRGSNTGIRTWPPLNTPANATDLEKWNGTGAYAGTVPFKDAFAFASADAVVAGPVAPDGSVPLYNHLSRVAGNGPDVPWDVEVGPRAEVRERYADLLAA